MTGGDEHEVKGYSGINYKLHISDRECLQVPSVSACIMQTFAVYIDQLNPDCL